MLQFLPYALAAYGGYKGYRASKDAGGSPLQRLLATGTGAFLGYQGGKLVPGVSAAGFGNVQSANFLPSFTQLGPIQSLGQTFPSLGIPKFTPQITNTAVTSALPSVDQAALSNSFFVPQSAAQTSAIASGANTANVVNANQDTGGVRSIFDKLFRRPKVMTEKDTGIQRVVTMPDGKTPVMEFSPGKVASAVALTALGSGAFDPKPVDVYTPTYNLAVAELQKRRGGFKYIDPQSGEEKTFEQPFIPEADRDPDFTMGPYELAYNKFNEGGLADIKKFNEGGINYLPSKVTHDENDMNNYVRAKGYVEDGSGTGDKDEDTMLAQLADGEFVTRADGVLGAGIIAGGNPNSMKDMRAKGAQYFYEQQRRYKRVFDLLKGSRDAKAKAN